MIVTFDGFKEKKKEVEEYKKSICKLIDEFITTDVEFKKNHKINGTYEYSYDFYDDNLRGGFFTVDYSSDIGVLSSSDQFVFSGLEYRRLKEFMKDPELYRNKNKFNI